MVKKIFTFKGKTIEELEAMDVKEFAKLLPSRQRRTIERGFTDMQKTLLEKIGKGKTGKYKKPIKTHCRDMIILPLMVDMTLNIHRGKDFVQIVVQPEMIGHYFGEFAHTRGKVSHSSPGIGATKSSSGTSKK